MTKTKTEKAAQKASRKIRALSNPTHEQIATIYREFHRYAHMP